MRQSANRVSLSERRLPWEWGRGWGPQWSLCHINGRYWLGRTRVACGLAPAALRSAQEWVRRPPLAY